MAINSSPGRNIVKVVGEEVLRPRGQLFISFVQKPAVMAERLCGGQFNNRSIERGLLVLEDRSDRLAPPIQPHPISGSECIASLVVP